MAFGLLDIEGPWFRRERHWGLFHLLLDGHHKTAVAAANNTPIRLLTFVSAGESLAAADKLLRTAFDGTVIDLPASKENLAAFTQPTRACPRCDRWGPALVQRIRQQS